jgi:hypothetical protein
MDYLQKELFRIAKINHVRIKAITDAALPVVKKRQPAKTKQIVSFISLTHHENTRINDMPNDLCKKLWNENRLRYLESKEQHLKMRKAQTNDERAKCRQKILNIEQQITTCWKLIDDEIERLKETEKNKEQETQQQPDFNVQNYRSYISKALDSEKLSDKKLVEVQKRVDALNKFHLKIKSETIERLKKLGIKTE